MLDRVERMFGVARESVTNPAYQALEREWQPKLAAAADAILFNQGLFKRIERRVRGAAGFAVSSRIRCVSSRACTSTSCAAARS